jgi:hypothetical protein
MSSLQVQIYRHLHWVALLVSCYWVMFQVETKAHETLIKQERHNVI